MISRTLFCVAALTLLSACGSKKSDSDAATQTASAPATESEPVADEAPVAEREHVDRNTASTGLKPQQQIGGNEGRSPFVGERVIGLNAIVNRSLTTIRDLDKQRAGIRSAVEAAAAPGASLAVRETAAKAMETINAFYDSAKLARDDMAAAENELKASGEYYDEVIFYGMVKFTQDVELDVREEKEALEAKLSGK